MSSQGQSIHTFIPGYVVKSNYLPTVVNDGGNAITS